MKAVITGDIEGSRRADPKHRQAVGLLIAAKSVFRFSDLSRSKDRKLTEYILIGTLLSFGLAIFFGLMYKYVSGLFLR